MKNIIQLILNMFSEYRNMKYQNELLIKKNKELIEDINLIVNENGSMHSEIVKMKYDNTYIVMQSMYMSGIKVDPNLFKCVICDGYTGA